jgi:hypothetical protein
MFTERVVAATSSFLSSYMTRENARLDFDCLWHGVTTTFAAPDILKHTPVVFIGLHNGVVECREYLISHTFSNIWGYSTIACVDAACNGILRVKGHPKKPDPTRGWHHWLRVVCPACKLASTTIDRPPWVQPISKSQKYFWKPLELSMQTYIHENWDIGSSLQT